MSKQNPRMSKAMFQALHDAIWHGDATRSLNGRSSHGWMGTRAALVRNGWYDFATNKVTDAGREAYEQVAARNRPFPYGIAELPETTKH